MMPADGIETSRGFDAIVFGAVVRLGGSVSRHGRLLPIREILVHCATMRPQRLPPGVARIPRFGVERRASVGANWPA